MLELLQTYHLQGIVIGLSTFLVIGIFHPITIKCEYYFGKKCWWWFLVLGIVFMVLSVLSVDVLLSTLCGVIAFSSFWTIKEVFEQEERVRKGWFPRNPKRTYPWDKEERGERGGGR